MDSDEVVDFMVMEAVALKANKEEQDAQDKNEKKEWKRDKEGLDKLRESAGM